MEQEVQLEEAAGRMVNLSCEVQSYPPPVVSWNIVGSQVGFLLCIFEDKQLLLDAFL